MIRKSVNTKLTHNFTDVLLELSHRGIVEMGGNIGLMPTNCRVDARVNHHKWWTNRWGKGIPQWEAAHGLFPKRSYIMK